MSYERNLKTILRDLDVPEHQPGFWDELELLLGEETDIGDRRRTRKRRWRVPVASVAAVAAAVMLIIVLSPRFLTSTVLAYSFSDGTYTYDISYLETHHAESTGEGSIGPGPDVSTAAEGTLTYTVEEGPQAGMKTVAVHANVSDLNIDCGHPLCADDLFRDIPEYRVIVDSTGGFVRTLSPDSDTGFPALVLPEPLPGSNLYGGLPFGFGPPFPEHPLDVGDSWATSGPRSAFWEDGPRFTAEHTVVEKETIVGRDTMVISSIYQTPAAGTANDTGFGTETAEVTVWFDPTAGIIVRAELESTDEHDDGVVVSSGTTHIVVELIEER